MRQLIALGAASVAALVGDVPGAAVADAAPTSSAQPADADVCVIDLDRRTLVGCFDDEIEAHAGAVAAGIGAGDDRAGWASPSGGQILAIHYEHHNGMGTSFQVWGSCNGGELPIGSPWAYTLSSTMSGPCTVKHHTGVACDGHSQSAPPGVMTNLDPSLNDHVRCLSYS